MRLGLLAGRWKFACMTGVLIGTAYAASPLAVWFVGLLAGIFVWAGQGLGERERRYVWSILALAVAIRVLAIAILFLRSDPGQLTSFPWDGDGVYIKFRAMVIRDVWMGVPVGAVDFFNAFMPYYGWSAYIYVLAYLDFITGPAPYGAHLLNVLLFTAAATLLWRLARDAYGRVPAICGWVLILFQPTLIAWSVSALKESLCLFLFAVGLRAVVAVVRGPGVVLRGCGLVALALSVAAADPVRAGAAPIMIVGLMGGVLAAVVARRPALIVAASLCLPLVAMGLWQRPAIQGAIMAKLNAAGLYHRASFLTAGESYALLDERFYRQPSLSKEAIDMNPEEAGRFVVRALASFVALPLPWRLSSTWAGLMAPQQMLWYLLLPLAAIGCLVGLRHDALVTCLLAGLAVSGAGAFAINNGNIGTMVRFRDWIVPFVLLLSAVGATWAVVRLMSTDAVRAPRSLGAGGPSDQAVPTGGSQIGAH